MSNTKTSSSQTSYPPFCELCLVKLNTNSNAELHFNGVNHYNKIMLLSRKKEGAIWCDICCVEVNTDKIYEAHINSPKHKKKEEAWSEISALKEEYVKMKQDSGESGDNNKDN